MNRTSVFVILTILCLTAAARSAEPPAGYRLKLFNGENLDGWVVTGCEAGVADGTLLIKAGNGLVRTQHRYSDFILELQWRALREDRWDSGVFFRAEPASAGKAWPERYQANLLKGREGEFVGGQTRGAENYRKGQWNQMKLTVVGRTAVMEINGRQTWCVDSIEAPSGYIGLQAEVPGGGQFEFKDIFVTELCYRAVFNGRDLTGWEGGSGEAAKCWKAADGLLVCTGQPGPWLRSQERFGDFNLRLEYKLRPGGNSGVYIRVPKGGEHHGQPAGIEVQILDDAAPRYKTLQPYQYTGSLYAIVAATPRVGRPPGNWNTMEINCQGLSYRVVHNGVTVIDANACKYPELKERQREGFLGLQNHNEEVQFRNLRLGPPQPQ